MGLPARMFRRVPVTSVFVLSGSLWLLGTLLLGETAGLVLLYLVGLPYYLISLGATALAIAAGVPAGIWTALALVLALDGILATVRVLAVRRGDPS